MRLRLDDDQKIVFTAIICMIFLFLMSMAIKAYPDEVDDYIAEVYIYYPQNYMGLEKRWHWLKLRENNIIQKHANETQIEFYSTPTPGGGTVRLWMPDKQFVYYPPFEQYLEREKHLVEIDVNGRKYDNENICPYCGFDRRDNPNRNLCR